MESLQQMLQDKYGWLTSTTGAKHVSVKLDASQLARIMRALHECENPALPKIEPRMLTKNDLVEPRSWEFYNDLVS